MEFDLDMIVECPVRQAFRACDSAKHQIHWIASLVEVEIDAGQEWGEGSTFRQIHEESGIRQVFDGQLLEYVPNELISMRLSHNDFTILSDLRFEDLGARCRIVQHTQLQLTSLALKLMKGTIAAVAAKRMEEDFDRLKAMLESH